MSAFIFYPLWAIGVAGYLTAWTYGEIGTFDGAPYAKLSWVGSVFLAVILVAVFIRRLDQ